MKNKLPPYTYPRPRRSAYCFRPYVKGQKHRPEFKLCDLDAPLSELWAAYERMTQGREKTHNIRWLLNVYVGSEAFTDKSEKTQKNQLSLMKTICDYKHKTGTTVGDTPLTKVTAGYWTKFMEAMKKKNMTPTANNCRSLMSVAWDHAHARDIIFLDNPIEHSIKFKTQSRDRYVTDDEYAAVYSQAVDFLQKAMELAYLCRLRSVEVLEMKQEQLLAEGVLCKRKKGSKDNIAVWNDRLRKAVEPLASSEFVVHYKSGNQVAYRELNKKFREAIKASGVAHFTFHDLKAKGISDTDAELRKGAGGHRSDSAAQVYDRTIDNYQPAAE